MVAALHVALEELKSLENRIHDLVDPDTAIKAGMMKVVQEAAVLVTGMHTRLITVEGVLGDLVKLAVDSGAPKEYSDLLAKLQAGVQEVDKVVEDVTTDSQPAAGQPAPATDGQTASAPAGDVQTVKVVGQTENGAPVIQPVIVPGDKPA